MLRLFWTEAVFATILSAAVASPPLNVLRTGPTPNGFTAPPRGWNSFGLQASNEVDPSWVYNQTYVTQQCDVFASNAQLKAAKYTYCSLDSGWSVGGNGDEYGRIINDPSVFNITEFSAHLHSEGLQLGVYILPGSFCADGNKTILGTDILIEDTWLTGVSNGLARCDFNFSKDGVQEWHNSVINLFAEWEVDLIKLDYVTPGSPDPGTGVNLPANNSGSVIAYHKAIEQSGRPMRLDISWKLDRNSTYFPIWEGDADSMRVDQDIDNYGGATFVQWNLVQREIENYRQYAADRAQNTSLITIYPDMDNMFVANDANITGVPDTQRTSIMTHWIGAAANLITGSDLTRIDSLGLDLMTDSEALAVMDFTAAYPMQPRNPGTGESTSQQLQAWIAGPNSTGSAVVVLANYGPDQGSGGYGTSLAGVQGVNVTWSDLGISGSWAVRNVWAHEDLGTQATGIGLELDEGESALLTLTQA